MIKPDLVAGSCYAMLPSIAPGFELSLELLLLTAMFKQT